VVLATALALFLPFPGSATPAPLARGVDQEAAAHLGFSFSPGTCEQGTDFCAVATPRAWAPAEVDLVRAALDQIAASDLGARILERARRNGFRTFRRFAQSAALNQRQQYEARPMVVANTHSDGNGSARTIDLTDRFFERASARDRFSGQPGYLLTTEILVHELAHAVDLDQQYSGTAEFRRVARLGMPAGQQQEADRANLERERLNAEGRHEDAWQASRSFALVTLRGRLPSVHTLDNYREAFAEFNAHLVLDPNARRLFEPRVVQFIERAVSGVPQPSPAADR
jgi:hypothetical protein